MNKTPTREKYKPMCFQCGIERYSKKRKNALQGITVSMGKCSECGKKDVDIIPARDWAYRAGEFEKVI